MTNIPKPTVAEAFSVVLDNLRSKVAASKPAPAPTLTARAAPALRLAVDAGEREAVRQEALRAQQDRERANAAEQIAFRWNTRAVALAGFPPLAVADLGRYEATIRAKTQWKSLIATLEAGGMAVMKGPPGTAKTTTAAALARWYIREKSLPASYWKVDDYIAEFRQDTQGFAAPIKQAKWIENATARDGLLVLDELDKMPALYGDNFMARQATCWLEAIIDARYAAINRPTILISNFNNEDWDKYVPAPTRDRIKRGGVEFNFGGPSLRGDA